MTNFYLNKLIHFVLLIGIGCHEGNPGDNDVVIAGGLQITNEPLAYPAEKATETGIDIEKINHSMERNKDDVYRVA